MAGKKTKPDWLKPGALVRVQHWCGIVNDVAISDQRIMVLIKSPKGVVRNQRDAAEWLEYLEGQIEPVDSATFDQEIDQQSERLRRMMNALDDMKQAARSG
jgi:hypothetical protein